MGLGGYLTWTAAAREIRKVTGTSVKLFPVEQLPNGFLKLIKSEVFINNPDILMSDGYEYENNQIILPLVLNNPNANYCKVDTPEKVIHRYDSHIIEQICECYGIKDPDLRCVVNLTIEEETFGKDFHEAILYGERFIVIEPFSKDNYTQNRSYPFEKWQRIVDEISKDIKVVQVGNSGKVLNNIVDLTNETTFREAIALIGRADLFLSPESGLVHGATAVDTKSLVVITGYQDERMVAYPQNINVNISSHGPCGLKVNCPECESDANLHDHQEIVKIIREELCL